MQTVSALLAAVMFVFALSAAGAPPVGAEDRQSASLSEADRAALSRVETYLNGIQTLRTDFTQIAPDNSVARGKIYLSRPGRMRVQFDPPHRMVMVATSVWLIIDDGSMEEPTYLPLRTSPAAILIKEEIDLTDAEEIAVQEVARRNSRIFVTITDADEPDQGSVTMILQEEPIRLLGWTVTDAQDQATRVTFANTETGVELEPDLFQYVSPERPNPFDQFESR